MAKQKDFIKDRLAKARPVEELGKGDSITMFNNAYKVVSPRGSSIVMLQDTKDLTFAMPANRVQFLMNKNLVKKMYKAADDSFEDKAEKALPPSTPAKSATPSVGDGKGKVAALYTVHNGRMKVQMNPPKWVHVQTGKSHNSAKEEDKEHHDLHHESDAANATKFHRNITMKAHGDDHEKLKKMITSFLGKERAYKNMKDVHRGMVQGKEGVPKATLDQAFKLHEEATKAWKTFTEAYRASVKKKIQSEK